LQNKGARINGIHALGPKLYINYNGKVKKRYSEEPAMEM